MLDVCPICNKNIDPDVLIAPALDVQSSIEYVYGMCHECDVLILLNPPYSEEQVDYTSSGYYQRAQTRWDWLADSIIAMFISSRIRMVQKLTGNAFLKGKHLLDIGCGKGKFLVSAKRKGVYVSGLEPTLRSFEFARSALGDDVQNKIMSKELFPSGTFDIVTMWHVFEHISDPSSMLEACYTVLRSDGMLVISVPNYKGLVARIGGATWFNLDPPRHVIHYGPLSLTRLLEKNGFEVVKTSYFHSEITILSGLQTLLNKLPITKNFLFNYLKRNSQMMPAERAQYFIDGILTIAGSILFAPVVLVSVPILSYVRLSDCIIVSARKK